ncbi:hypothetical protein NQ854_05800 [Rhodococcus ruber]|uniref:hypothetical protein n=1 Tax=Rhodococcus TaxID=1827 RepID=UPI0006612162|nr:MULTISPECIES: hypothetical protein [Rhodococcus]RIK11986.1 MAG: hypothetical protein DCC47_08880 [Acidobacteriota bacterium]AXY51046.1 hypothetical protein YT1_1611 [Rhodococcus ruber]MCZ1070747.1 hypothetical protein [Rhodococcus sp. A5(2022)]MDO1477452.1 hypothetical protein [Rhodococcus ruber]RQM34617.1 hypothetical protein TN91_08510 [Rhodococcus ruber]
MDSTLNDRIRHLARYWPIVVLATLLAVGGAVWTTGQSATEYTGRSALIVSSQNRAPEQDAVLVQGYVDLFNDSSYQEQLRVVGSLPADTSFSARTAAAGPILFVEATAGDAETAAEAARIMAGTFRDDVNSVRDRGREGSLEELRQRLDEERSRPGIADNVALAQLQAQISELELDATNQIQDLQLNAGVSEDSPSLFRNVALGLLGGMVLGVLVALALDSVMRRISTTQDVRERLGIESLGVVPAGGSTSADRARQLAFHNLVNTLAAGEVRGLRTVALTSPTGGEVTGQVARQVARRWSRSGVRVVVIPQNVTSSTVAGAGAEAPGDGLRVLSVRDTTGESVPLSGKRLEALLQQLRGEADVVLFDLAPVTEDADAQIFCAAAQKTVLVLDRRRARQPDAAEAVRLLTQVDAHLLGAVVVDPRGDTSAPYPPAEEISWSAAVHNHHDLGRTPAPTPGMRP